MGESEIASDYQTKAMACINSANKMEKSKAKNSILSCEKELISQIYSKFSVQKRNQFNEQLNKLESKCNTLDTYDKCYEKIYESMWN